MSYLELELKSRHTIKGTMVKGDKRNKREFERKQRQEGGSNKAGDGKSNEKKAGTASSNDRSTVKGKVPIQNR